MFAQIRMGRSLRSSDMKIFSIERERIGMEGRERYTQLISSFFDSLFVCTVNDEHNSMSIFVIL